MMILAMGQAAGKRTALINAVYQQEKDGFADVISGLDLMTVREVRSAAVARSHGGQPWVFLDSAADCRRLSRVDTPKREISGLVKGGTHPKAPSATWLERLAIEKIDMSSGSFDEIVSMLRRADIYVTGQHHGVYAAALAGIPFVAVVSNSHKIEGLIEWSGLPIPVVSNAGTLQSAIDYARRNRSVFEEFSQFITSKDVVRAEVLSNALLNS